MGDAQGMPAVATGVLVVAVVAVVVVTLAVAARRQRRGVVGGSATLPSASLAGALAFEADDPDRIDPDDADRLTAVLADLVGPRPGTVAVLATGGSTAGAAVAAALADAADRRGDPTTLVHGDATEAPSPVEDSVMEYDLDDDWLGADPAQHPASVDEFLEQLETEDDGARTVLLSLPPLERRHDARLFAPLVDVVLVVATTGSTPRADVAAAVAELEDAGAPAVRVALVADPGSAGAADRRRSMGVLVAVAVTTVLALGPLLLDLQPAEEGGGTTTVGAAGAARTPDVPGRGEPGIYLSASPGPGGDVRVVEQLVVDRPVDTLRLVPPKATTDGATPPRLGDLQVLADGEPVDAPQEVEGETGASIAVPPMTRRLELTYSVLGAGVQRPAAPPGRTTIRLAPAARSTFPDLRVVTDVEGATVLTLVCPEAPPDRRLCGVDRGTRWLTRPMRASRAAVVALVDLPEDSGV